MVRPIRPAARLAGRDGVRHHRRVQAGFAHPSHWASAADIEFGHTVYIGLSAVLINLIVAVVLKVILRAA
jgi:hypothetical protein